MPFDWKNLSSIANFLKNNCDDLNTGKCIAGECIDREATYRTVINRAYYAAYNIAKQFALKEFKTISKKGGAHESLIKTFQIFKNDNPEYARIAAKLDRIKKNRNHADYFPIFPNAAFKNEAGVTLRESQNIISSIEGIEHPTC